MRANHKEPEIMIMPWFATLGEDTAYQRLDASVHSQASVQ